MKPEVGKHYNIHYVAPDKRSTSYTGTGECLRDLIDLFEFLLPDGRKGLFAKEDIISKYERVAQNRK